MTPEQNSYIDFVLVTHTKGIFFNPHRPEGLEFIPPSNSLHFTLRPNDPEDDGGGIWKGLVCKLSSKYPANKEQYNFVDSYNNHKTMLRVADDISLPFKPREEILIDGNGKFKDGFLPRRYLCPPDISQLLESVESELAKQTNHFLKLLRWRQGIDAPGDVIDSQSLYWRIGDGEYPIAPPKQDPQNKLVIPGMHGIQWDNEYSKNLQEMWAKDNIEEPFGHTLVREASALASDSSRSAILMMTTALETALKMHISEIAPDTNWLLEEIPSPPIFKILRDYIPLIHLQRGNELGYWEKVKPFLKKVQRLVEIRNKVAHTGKIPADAGAINGYLELVSDLLYLLDVLAGHDWAKQNTSPKFRKALGWPNPKHDEITFTISTSY